MSTHLAMFTCFGECCVANSRNHQFLDGQQAFGSALSDDTLSDVARECYLLTLKVTRCNNQHRSLNTSLIYIYIYTRKQVHIF